MLQTVDGRDQGHRELVGWARETALALARVVGNPDMRRLQLAFFGFNVAEWATWIAILVYAYQRGGATAAGVVSVVQLVPAAIAAPLASSYGDRYPRQRFLLTAYITQTGALAATAVALLAGAPVPVAYTFAAVASASLTLTRPAQGAFLPSLARTPEDLTAANGAAGTIESVSVLVGPALAGALLAVGEPGAVFAVMAGTVGIGAVLVAGIRTRPPARAGAPAGAQVLRHAFGGLVALAADPRPRLVVLLSSAEFVVIGALDVLYVVMAIPMLGLGQSGAGYLNAAVGLGGIAGGVATLTLMGRSRLSGPLAAGVALAGIPVALIGLVPRVGTAVAFLALVGAGHVVADVAARTLLQRIVPDEVLARVFGAMEGLQALTLAVGSMSAAALVGWLGPRAALVATGLFLPIVVAVAWRRIRRVDAEAPAPEPMLTLARGVPLFAPLATLALERVARDMVPVAAPTGTAVVRQGEEGDRFYVIHTGKVEVVRDGRILATMGPGGFFGEIALLKDVPRTATVTAVGDTELFALGREDFLRALTGHPESLVAADAVAGDRLREQDA
jgi:MFS family permease